MENINRNNLKKLNKDDLITMILSEITSLKNNQTQNTEINEHIIICNNLFHDVGFMLNNGAEITILANSTQSISVNDCNIILGIPLYKELFTTGLIYFENLKWYKIFSIKEPDIITDDYLISILSDNNQTSIISKLNILTRNKMNATMLNYLSHKIASVAKINKSLLNFEIASVLDDYFSTEYNRVSLSKLKNLQDIKKEQENEI